jgi:hypothetical protein
LREESKAVKESLLNEITIYEDDIATINTIAKEVVKLKKSFPQMEQGAIEILTERLLANGFTEQRLKDAIADVIDNFKYKIPNIADIIQFDKRVKLYTYNEAYMEIEKGAAVWEDFRIIERNETKYRIKLKDL